MSVTLADAPQVEAVPSEARRAPWLPTWLPPVAWAALGLAMALLALRYWHSPPYSFDSWGYYELSKHLGADFLRIDTYRSYQSPEPYSSSFGPMWPIVIRIVGTVTGTTVRAGFIAGFACVAATAVVVEGYGRRVAGLRGFGPLVALGLLAFTPYLHEVVAARSIPLALLLVSALLWVLARPAGGTPWSGAAAGALGALLVMTRTDILLAVVLLYGAAVVARRLPWRRAAVTGAAFVVVMLPWVVYSLVHFHTLLVGDNKLIASAVQPHRVTDVLDPTKVPTLTDDPWGWLLRVLGNVAPVADSWWAALSPSVMGTAVAGAVWLLASRSGRGPSWLRLPLVLLACFTVQTAMSELTTGYQDLRYLSGMVLLVLVIAVGAIMSGEVPVRLDAWRAAALAGVALLAVSGYAVYHGGRIVQPGPPDMLSGGVVEHELRHCDRPDSTLITYGLLVASHGALSGRPTGVIPTNLATLPVADRRAWVVDYRVGQYYEPPTDSPTLQTTYTNVRHTLATVAVLTPDPCARLGTLYRLTPKPANAIK